MPPRFLLFMMSVVQVPKPAWLPIEPKKLMTVSASTTISATSVYISLLMNSVRPNAIVKMPQRMYPQEMRLRRLPVRSA